MGSSKSYLGPVAGFLIAVLVNGVALAGELFFALPPVTGFAAAILTLLAAGTLFLRRLGRDESELDELHRTLNKNIQDLQGAAEAYSRFVPVQFEKGVDFRHPPGRSGGPDHDRSVFRYPELHNHI